MCVFITEMFKCQKWYGIEQKETAKMQNIFSKRELSEPGDSDHKNQKLERSHVYPVSLNLTLKKFKKPLSEWKLNLKF